MRYKLQSLNKTKLHLLKFLKIGNLPEMIAQHLRLSHFQNGTTSLDSGQMLSLYYLRFLKSDKLPIKYKIKVLLKDYHNHPLFHKIKETKSND